MNLNLNIKECLYLLILLIDALVIGNFGLDSDSTLELGMVRFKDLEGSAWARYEKFEFGSRNMGSTQL